MAPPPSLLRSSFARPFSAPPRNVGGGGAKEKDHIVLKLETAWPPDVALPVGLSLGNDDALLLVANQESLIQAAKNTLPREAKISKALFCGCEAFHSSDGYRNAAIKLLPQTREIWSSPCRTTFAGTTPWNWTSRAGTPRAPLVEGCQLTELVGGLDFVGAGNVRLGPLTVMALLRTCPNVIRIDSISVANCLVEPHGLLSSAHTPRATSFTHLSLFSRDCVLGLVPPGETSAVDVALAAKQFTSIKHLKVAVGSMKSFAEVAAFRNLRSLAVMLSPFIALSDVNCHLKELLTSLPHLEELSLEGCGGLMFHTFATFCPRIKRLRLANCTGATLDTMVNEGAFPNLEFLAMSIQVMEISFGYFLRAVRETLRTAVFGDDANSAQFLRYCAHRGRHFPFVNLESLTLATDRSLRALELEPRDLHDVAKALPALRHLETDSYDLRLFFENCVPRGRVSLSWLGCVYCKVNDPNTAKLEEIGISGQVQESTPGCAIQ
ncbi:hypothetical protein MTO96_023108 [Rhipicephalus appendiculatus]